MSLCIYLVKVELKSKLYEWSSMYYPPQDLMALGTILKKNGYRTQLVHDTGDIILDQLKKAQERSVIIVEVPFYNQIAHSIELCREIKAHRSDLTVVWVGEMPSFYPETCAGSPYIDFSIRGEYEGAVCAILEGSWSGKDGIYTKDASEKVFGKGYTTENRTAMTYPDWDLADMSRYIYQSRDGSKALAFMTSKGCRFRCSFCFISRPENAGRWCGFSVDEVTAQIENLRTKCDFDEIHFYDRNFLMDRERAYAIMDRVRAMGLTVHALDVRLDLLDDDFIQRVLSWGVKGIFVGIESGSDRLLELMNKKTSRLLITEKISLTARYHDLKVYGNIIYALPTQTYEEFMEDVCFAEDLKKVNPGLMLSMVCYRPYPDTPLYALAAGDGYREPETLDGWADHFAVNEYPLPSWIHWDALSSNRVLLEIISYKDMISFTPQRSGYLSIVTLLENTLGGIFYRIALARVKRLEFRLPVERSLFSLLARANFFIKRLVHVI